MRKTNTMTIIVVILLVLTSLSIRSASAQTTTVSYEVIPDPNLQTGIELHTNGESEEFNASHVLTGGISSYVNLSWIHIAGTELTLTSDEVPFRSQQDSLPHYWDFCYFTVSFPWELERMPTDAMFYVSYGIHTTGDFNSTEGESMFNVYTWLIDSSDDWQPLIVSESPYTTTVRRYSYDLNWFDLMDGWQGMVVDDSGVQEDPEDVLSIGVGLAPSESFESYGDSHPWQEYNGSVAARVQTLRLEVLLEPEETSFIIDPYYLVAAPVGMVGAVVIIGYLLYRRR